MKTIALFGATGKCGRVFLEAALAAGYRVQALVRDPARLALAHPHLTVLPGDALKAADVTRTVVGADIVVSLLGQGPKSPTALQSKAGHYIVNAMKAHEVRRIISLTSAAVDCEHDQLGWGERWHRLLMELRQGKQVSDARRHARLLLLSGTAWEIVRVPRLTDGPALGQWRTGWVGVDAGPTLTRADLAQFLLQELETEERLFQLPLVSN